MTPISQSGKFTIGRRIKDTATIPITAMTINFNLSVGMESGDSVRSLVLFRPTNRTNWYTIINNRMIRNILFGVNILESHRRFC